MVVEELIGKITLRSSGLKDAQAAVKTLEAIRKALKGLTSSARMNFDGPAKAAKAFNAMRREVEKVQAAQKQLGSGGGLAKADGIARKHVTTVQRLAAAYKEAASASALIGRRPSGSGRSWMQDELKQLREYQKLQRQIGTESSRRGRSRSSVERELGPVRYGARDRGVAGGGLRNPLPGAVDVRGLLDKGFDSATTIPQVQSQMRMRKESEPDIERATKLAEKLSGEVKQFTTAEHLQGIYQSLAVFGDMDKALKAAPGLSRANALIEGLSDQFTRLKPFKGGAATKDFARIFDMMGATENPKKMDALSEGIIKSLEQSSGDITPSDILQALKMARSARYGYNPDFIQNYLGGIIGDVKSKGGGGQSAGTMLQSFYKNFHDLNAPKYILENMAKDGLIDGSKLARTDKGKVKGPGTAEVVEKKLLEQNPQLWATKVLQKFIEKRQGALTGDDETDAPKVLAGVPRYAGERLAKDFATSAILQRDERERDANITRKMPGIAGLEELNKAPVGILQQFTAGVTELFAALAAPAVQPALAAMKSFGDMARSVANFQRDNPEAAKVVSGAATAAAAGTAAGGAVVTKKAWDWFRGGKTPGSGNAPTTPPETPSPTTPAEASPVRPGPPVGPQESILDRAARAGGKAALEVGKLGAAAAVGPTSSLTKGDQDALVRRLGAFAQGEAAKKASAQSAAPATAPASATTTPGAGAAATATAAIAKFDGKQVEARLSEIQASSEKLAESLHIKGSLSIDTAAIDAASAKVDQLKAKVAGLNGAIASAGSGIGGSGLSKGSNSFTSSGATAP